MESTTVGLHYGFFFLLFRLRRVLYNSSSSKNVPSHVTGQTGYNAECSAERERKRRENTLRIFIFLGRFNGRRPDEIIRRARSAKSFSLDSSRLKNTKDFTVFSSFVFLK